MRYAVTCNVSATVSWLDFHTESTRTLFHFSLMYLCLNLKHIAEYDLFCTFAEEVRHDKLTRVRAPLLVLPPKKKLETMLVQAAGDHARRWLPRSELPQLAVLRINRGFMEYMKEARGANKVQGA